MKKHHYQDENTNQLAGNKNNRDVLFLSVFFFIFVFGYFSSIGNYLLSFQEQQSLFVFSPEFLRGFLLKPGGILELSGKFLTQFYFYTLPGSFILASVIATAGILSAMINRHLQLPSAFSFLFMFFTPCLLLLMQMHYYHFMEYNLGFLLVLFFFLLSILSKKKYLRYIITVLIPLFYYIAGSFALMYAGMYLLYNLIFGKGFHKFVYSVITAVLSATSVFVCKEFLFLQPLDQLIFFPLPFINDPKHTITFYVLAGLIVLYPLLSKISLLIRPKSINTRPVAIISSIAVFCITIFFIAEFYNKQTARTVKIEQLAFDENWDDIIRLQEKFPSRNLIGQYFYNVALSETNQLCDRLFYGSQDFSANSLILPWGGEHLNRGGYFYYSIGLINEAHRWAYEGMVVYGMRPQNLKLLIKTNLINGNYKMADKYISILKRTMNYRKWVDKYAELTENPLLINKFPDLEAKREILPDKDFFIQLDSPQNNILLLFDSNPGNKKAFEYEMAWLMLMKDVEGVVNNMNKLKELGYTRIPRHLEEAALIYYNSKGTLPDLGGLNISEETLKNFNDYVSTYKNYRQNLAAGKERIKQYFGNTFMFYFHFQ